MSQKNKSLLKNTLVIRVIWVLILALLIFIAIKFVNFNDYYKVLHNTNPLYLILFLFLSVLTQFFKAVSYYSLLKGANVHIPFNKSVRVFFASQLTTFIPGGEVGRVMLTKTETKESSEKIASAVISQAFVELISAMVVVLVGSLYFNAFRIPSLLSLLLLSFLLFVVFSENMWKFTVKFFAHIKFLKKFKSPILNLQNKIRTQVFKKDSFKFNYSFIYVLMYAFLSHFTGGLLIYFISLAFGLNLNILSSIFIFSVSILIQGLVTIIPGGLGFTEGGLLGLLLYFGNTFNNSVALTITFRLTGFIFNILLGLILFIIYYPKGFKKKHIKK